MGMLADKNESGFDAESRTRANRKVFESVAPESPPFKATNWGY
jgi:hypothetical protein